MTYLSNENIRICSDEWLVCIFHRYIVHRQRSEYEHLLKAFISITKQISVDLNAHNVSIMHGFYPIDSRPLFSHSESDA